MRPVRIVGRDGSIRHYKVEIAATLRQQAMGMMFRTAAPKGTGMLFPSDRPEQRAFWMRNTLIPLDIIYIAPGGRIESIAANTVPLDETPIPSRGPVEAVLELAGGEAGRAGIRVGDRVVWR